MSERPYWVLVGVLLGLLLGIAIAAMPFLTAPPNVGFPTLSCWLLTGSPTECPDT